MPGINKTKKLADCTDKLKITTNMISRVHSLSKEGKYLTAYVPCTNTLHQVTPVNYCILMDVIYA